MDEPPVTFAALLRKLRTQARLTQEELAEASGVRPRSISDLERGVAVSPQRETIRRLADALNLPGPDRAQFEAVARGRSVPFPAEAADQTVVATRTLPRDVASFTGRQQELQELVDATVGLAASPGVVSIHAIGGMAGVGKTAQVAGKQLLLVLDDAASSDRVLPLLPGTGGSLVLVTSRRHLSALDDAAAVSLDTLPPDQAAALLVRLAGRAGLSPDDPAVDEITRLCGFLPLAIGMLARQLHHHPAWSLAGRAAELTAARDRLELMVTENVSVTAAFNLSYADLTEDQRRLFRRLGSHPGADFDAYAAAALVGTDLPAARHGLEALYDQ